MKRIASLIAAGLLAITFAGCSTPFGERLQRTFSAIEASTSLISTASAATVSRKAVLVSANVFDGLQATSRQYLLLPRCSGGNGPICRDPAATVPLINAVSAARKVRKSAIAFVKTHPCPKGQTDCSIGAGGLYDGLQSAIATAQTIFTQYNVAGVIAAKNAGAK